MATRTIEEGFNLFAKSLVPSSVERSTAASHKASITSRLEAHFDLQQLFYSGSANNGTAVARHSDADFFAHIPTSKLKQRSSTSLREIKECLQGRFTSTKIYVDSPAVVLEFGSGDWDKVEVIPADYVADHDGKRVYDIPDGAGGWMRSSPMLHNRYVDEHNSRLSGRLNPLIRMIKAWKYYCDVPISSFYLEIRVTKYMENDPVISYPIDIRTVLKKLLDCDLAAVQDPKGVSGYIRACASDAQKSDALSKLNTAFNRADKARDAEKAGRISDAFEWWGKLYSGKFHSYYYY